MSHTWGNQTAPKRFKRPLLVIIIFNMYEYSRLQGFHYWMGFVSCPLAMSLRQSDLFLLLFPSVRIISGVFRRKLRKTTTIFYHGTSCFWQELFLILCLHFGFFVYFMFTISFLLFIIWSLVDFYRFGVMYCIHLQGRGITRTSSNHSAQCVKNMVQFQTWKGVQRELMGARKRWFNWYSDGQENAYKLWLAAV
jgi:hypothetical protein